MSRTVALVLDSNFGDRVLTLAQAMPVWIISSPVNDRAVADLRPKFDDGRLTILLRRPDENTADTLARALIAIDEHHGGSGQADAYEVIEVHGANELPSEELSKELGFRSVVSTLHGFKAYK